MHRSVRLDGLTSNSDGVIAKSEPRYQVGGNPLISIAWRRENPIPSLFLQELSKDWRFWGVFLDGTSIKSLWQIGGGIYGRSFEF